MNKAKVNYGVDFLAFLSFLLTSLSGLAIMFFMPSGVRQGRMQEFLGLQKSVWSGIHDFFGVLLIILVVVHLILHWDWVVCMTKGVFKKGECEVEKQDNQ